MLKDRLLLTKTQGEETFKGHNYYVIRLRDVTGNDVT